MNERIIKLGLKSGILNYVDHETPRHYFLCGNADEKHLEKFAELLVRECCDIFVELRTRPADLAVKDVKKHFGVEE